MNEWEDLLSEILNREHNTFDNLNLYIIDEKEIIHVPKIIKSTLLLLENHISQVESKTIIVFPENRLLGYLFVIAKTIDDINNNKIDHEYVLKDFNVGEKVKILNYIVEYQGIEIKKGKECIKLVFKDAIYYCPIQISPILQKTITKRTLSKINHFENEINSCQRVNSLTENVELCQKLENSITHIKGSVIYVTSVMKVKKFLNDTFINSKPILDVLLVGQINTENGINILNSEQRNGVPPLILVSDLYQANDAVNLVDNLQAIYLDINNYNMLQNQFHMLDELRNKKIPIIFFSDYENSVDLKELSKRGFSIWKWTNSYLSKMLIGENSGVLDKKISYLLKHSIQKVVFNNENIYTAFNSLKEFRKIQSELSFDINRVIEILYSILIRCVRSVCLFIDSDIILLSEQIAECRKLIEKEKRYLNDDYFRKLIQILEIIKTITTNNNVSEKFKYIKELLIRYDYNQISLVIDYKENKNVINNYFDEFCLDNSIRTKVNVEYVYEFLKNPNLYREVTIICSWFNNKIMRSIYYSFITLDIRILLYNYELIWADYQIAELKSKLNLSDNKLLIKNEILNNGNYNIDEETKKEQEKLIDDIDEIEYKINAYKVNEYSKLLHVSNINELVDSIPIEFNGNYVMFSKVSHEFIVATKILIGESDEIELKSAEKLEVGDFIVIRESVKNIIKELADNVLKRNGLFESRELSGIWKESLRILSMFKSMQEIKGDLEKVGCNRNIATIKEWITNEERIMPNNKEDLIAIAKVTEDEVLVELVDKVYQSGKNVRIAHMKAGTILSSQLKTEIAELLGSNYEIDPYTNNNEYNISIDGIGKVKVIKILEIGQLMKVDISQVNKIINKN